MENRGQISAEFIFLTGVLIVIVMLSTIFIAGENELNLAMSAARNGVIEGVASSSAAMYADEAYDDYSGLKGNLMHPYSVDIINISYSELGEDDVYAKKKIQFKVYARPSDEYSEGELDSIGERINYNLRKSIAISFNSTSSTNSLYNPVFSPHYVFTTANIKWV